MTSFDVVVMTNAPISHIQKFCRYYVNLGARHVYIYQDGVSDNIPHMDNSFIIDCDNDFWRKIGITRPDIVEDRQRAIYNDSYRTAECDWMLFVDIDEFVYGDQPISTLLDSAPSTIKSIRFPTVEAVLKVDQDIHADFEANVFRSSYNKYLAQVLPHFLYPGLGGFFIRGLLGHSIGKQLLRVGIKDVSVNIHHATLDGQNVHAYSPSDVMRNSTFRLAHFDAISFAQWREKWDRRVRHSDTKEMGKKREKQLEIYRRAKASNSEELLFRRLYVLSPLKELFLRGSGLLVSGPSVKLT